jgi:hypothetical protein
MELNELKGVEMAEQGYWLLAASYLLKGLPGSVKMRDLRNN